MSSTKSQLLRSNALNLPIVASTTTPAETLPSEGSIPEKDTAAMPAPASEEKGADRVEPVVESIGEPNKTAAPLPPAAENPVQETQPRLRGVEPKKRLPHSESEEDLLEIPAFLRRQAN